MVDHVVVTRRHRAESVTCTCGDLHIIWQSCDRHCTYTTILYRRARQLKYNRVRPKVYHVYVLYSTSYVFNLVNYIVLYT